MSFMERVSNNRMKISVIIPVYNAESYLPRCIDNILGQTYQDFELLLIDDGSTDSSSSMCENYASHDSRVRVFHKQNEGVSRARNYGLELAKGEWIWFVDSDDYAELDALQRFVNVLKVNPDIDIYKFGFVIEGDTRKLTFKAKEPRLLTSTSRMILEIETNCYTGFLWNTIFKRTLIDSKRFDEEISYCEDHLFSFNAIADSHKMFIDSKLSYHYVKHGDNSLSNIKRHSAYKIVKAACLNRVAKEKCIEKNADRDVVKKLMQKIIHSYKEQLYVSFDSLYSHSFNYKESKEIFGMINKRLHPLCAWLYFYIRYRIHKYRFERGNK